MAGFGSETRTVVLEFVGKDSGLSKTSDKTSQSLDGVSASSTKASGAMAKLKPAAIAAGAAAAAMAAKWAISGIEMAETAILLDSSFRKTFGDASDQFLEDNEEMRLALGLSEAEFQKQVTAIGAVNRGLHQTGEEAADFSGRVLAVSGDVAAFNGEIDNSEEVVEAINSALIGNTETLEKYGIEVTAAMVKQRALADSGKETEAELTQLEKRTATLALIEEQAALATGSLSEAMDSNQVKANQLEAQMADLQTEVGEALLPVKKALLEVLLAILPAVVALTPILESLAQVISILAKVLSPVIELLGKLLEFLVKIIVKVQQMFSPLNQLARVFDRVSNSIRQAFSWTPPKWMQSIGIKGFHSGGRVPGPVGTETIARLQGGEEVVPAASARASRLSGGTGGGGPQMVVNVTVNAGVGDPMEIGRQITDVLDEYQRQIGAA